MRDIIYDIKVNNYILFIYCILYIILLYDYKIYTLRRRIIETKKMIVVDVNMVFGVKEEPLIYHIDDIILPSLQ